MNFSFGEVLSRAWQIVWKHRSLWIFGILASCTRGGPSVNWNINGSDGGFQRGVPNLPPEMIQFFEFVTRNAVPIIAGSIAIVCILWIVAIFLGTIGRIGLIRGTWQAETGENVIFGQLFGESLPYFWRVFGLSLLVGLPFFLVFLALAASFVAFGVGAARMGEGNAPAFGFLAIFPLLVCCICLLVPIGIVASLIVRQAERAIVLENTSVLPALSRGWDVFRNNLAPIIVMAIILAVISLVAGFILAIPVIVVIVPATIAFIANQARNWTPMMLALACICILAPFLWLISGILMAYIESAWTLTYMRLTQPLDNLPAVSEANA